MRTEVSEMTISQFINLEENNLLIVDREYQRGETWTDFQKKKFIDSILRGFPIPMIILYKPNNSEPYHIIDGQQRRNAIMDFYNRNNFNLLDPNIYTNKFPIYTRSIDCSWKGLNYHNLHDFDKIRFKDYNLSICVITEASIEELRDIFIRLQSGSPLSSQEKRDAMPGDFCELILNTAGKLDSGYDSNDFYATLVNQTDIKGRKRQLAAQVSMLFFELEINAKIIDIDKKNIDDAYYEYLSTDEIDYLVKRLHEIYQKLFDLFDQVNIKKLENHEVIHLLLFVKECKNLKLIDWEVKTLKSFISFRMKLAEARNNENSKYYTEYLVFTKVNSTVKQNILRRHNFFSSRMLEFMFGDKIYRNQLNIEIDEYLGNHPLLEDYIELEYLNQNEEIKNLLISKFFNLENNIIQVPQPNIKEYLEQLILFHQTLIEEKRVEISNSIQTNNFSVIPEIISEITLKQNIIAYLTSFLEKDNVSISEINRYLGIDDNQNPPPRKKIQRLTNIQIFDRIGNIKKGNSIGGLIPILYPKEFGDGIQRNYVGIILGQDTGNPPIFEKFWDDYDHIEFMMKGRKRKVYRKDFKDYWKDRFEEID
jgi:hypothetical protein